VAAMLVGFCLGYVVASWYATNENMVAAGPLSPQPSLFPLNFLVVGDWGRRGRYNQTLVAAQVWNLQKRNSWSLQRNSCFSLSLSLSLSSEIINLSEINLMQAFAPFPYISCEGLGIVFSEHLCFEDA